MSRPRISASHHVSSDDIYVYGNDQPIVSTPAVGVIVEFSRGDHVHALNLLERAIEDVRTQIADAAEGSGE